MANAKKDSNGVSSMIAALNTNGISIVNLAVNPVTHALKINLGDTGVSADVETALKDDNGVSSMIGVSSDDLETPIRIHANSLGELLVDNT